MAGIPIWVANEDGEEILYREGRRILSVSVRTEPELRVSTPRLLFEAPYELETNGFRNFDVSSDGQRFVMVESEEAPMLDWFVVVLDWLEELERAVRSTE